MFCSVVWLWLFLNLSAHLTLFRFPPPGKCLFNEFSFYFLCFVFLSNLKTRNINYIIITSFRFPFGFIVFTFVLRRLDFILLTVGFSMKGKGKNNNKTSAQQSSSLEVFTSRENKCARVFHFLMHTHTHVQPNISSKMKHDKWIYFYPHKYEIFPRKSIFFYFIYIHFPLMPSLMLVLSCAVWCLVWCNRLYMSISINSADCLTQLSQLTNNRIAHALSDTRTLFADQWLSAWCW